MSKSKSKKKHSKKDNPAEDLLDMAQLSIKKFRKVTREFGKLSTGQKILGGLALAAAGVLYLAAQEAIEKATDDDDESDDAPALISAAEATDDDLMRKDRKPAKRRAKDD